MRLMHVNMLLVEDNPADANLIINHFKNSKDDITINHVVDGAEALDYLYQREDYKTASFPDIVILDMNLPKINGMTVLKTMKADDKLKRVPVIVFGTSDDSNEVMEAYKAQANCYIVKPIDYDNLNNTLKRVENFWINIVRLPSKL